MDIGIDRGQHVYQYNLSGTGEPYSGLSAICSANLRFPSTGIELVAGKMTIAGVFIGGTSGIASGIVSGITRPFGPLTMDYVTVQAIPEPATLALAAAAAAGVAALGRRREADRPHDAA